MEIGLVYKDLILYRLQTMLRAIEFDQLKPFGPFALKIPAYGLTYRLYMHNAK